MGAVFIFLSFLLYGTYDTHIGEATFHSVEVIQCSARYIDYMTTEVVNLRSGTLPGELKEMSLDEIQYKIHEFYLVIMDGKSVGCFRVFEPESIPGVLELWSVRSTESWVGILIASTAMSIAKQMKKQIVAITWDAYAKTLSKSWWIDATNEYPERMAESIQDKKLWTYNKL